MGRKIPKKKHRGIKDPEKQRVRRLAELEPRTNAPPKDEDEQAIPRSLEHVIRLKEIAKTRSIIKRKRKKTNTLICVGQQHVNSNLHSKTRSEKAVPLFQQKLGESGQQFWHRVSKETHAFLKEAAFEQKYGVHVERDPETGLIKGLTKHEINKDSVERLRIKHRNTGKKKTTAKDTVTLTKNEKRKLKLYLKKQKLEDNADKFERLQDKIVFGEVVHEPPKLKFKTKEINEEKKPKNLLLNSLLEGNTIKKISLASKVIGRSGKRRNLPVAERRKLDRQQSEAIAAYRRLKSQHLVDKPARMMQDTDVFLEI